MDILDRDKFKEQMIFLETSSFLDFVKKNRWYLLLLPLITGINGLFDGMYDWLFVKIFIVTLAGLVFYYWMYRFFKPIATGQRIQYSNVNLLVGYSSGLSILCGLSTSAWDSIFSNNFFIESVSTVIFGLVLGGIFTACLNIQLKEYLKIT